ncbi:MAG: tRNA (adenosine(37)-N6)-dimethylallyltransferase MiaA [Bacteroidetes bacterium]|nr:tRNA (adenosine(37)-N6)-dimethylallyltransferase MiaA [Bacteroidota bacterium]
MTNNRKLITILGPTASGKTKLAAQLAHQLNAEIISADSRQVYRGMDLGTGKDLDDYLVNGVKIPYHLINIVNPGYEYNIYEFQRDFLQAFQDIKRRNNKIILCGGSGMYLEAIIMGYQLQQVPNDDELRNQLNKLSDKQLREMLLSYKVAHNVTDLNDRKRLIRAIEIQRVENDQPKSSNFPSFKSLNFGIHYKREELKERITSRLKYRLKNGMIEEVRRLIENGIMPEQLKFYGLEYKFVTQHVMGEINYNDLFQKLNSAIHQFSKRQTTWFRRMEKKGIEINWIDGKMSAKEKLEYIIRKLK